MEGASLLKRGSQRPVQPVLKIEGALPLDDVGEQVAVEGRVLGQEGTQVEVALGGDEVFEPDHARRDIGPVPSRLQPVGRVGASVAHGSSITALRLAQSVSSRQAMAIQLSSPAAG